MSDKKVNNHYIAITIGPIGDTMALMDKPSALWLSSYMFSYICRSICKKLLKKGVNVKDIVSPFIPDENEEAPLYKLLMERKDGVGLFHDHIIFKCDVESWEKNNAPWKSVKEALKGINDIKNDVLDDVAKKLYLTTDKKDNNDSKKDDNKSDGEGATTEQNNPLKEYVMINACSFDYPVKEIEEKAENENKKKNESVILHCGRMLDSLELPKVFRRIEEKHPVRDYLQNENVKKVAASFMNVDENDDATLKNWNLVWYNNNGIPVFKDLPKIAKNGIYDGLKKRRYYCILRADGDNMSKILGTLENDEKCRAFSKTCLEYCSEVAKRVNSYGGITIFAGGDDLLAIVPCEGNVFDRKVKDDAKLSKYDYESKSIPQTKQGTVFGLVQDINEIFKNIFKPYILKIEKANSNEKDEKNIKPVPSLSFGALICYEKYPLYEALKRSGDLLFDVAKTLNGNVKNCIAVQLLKHSGQSEELLINMKSQNQNSSLEAFSTLLDEVIKNNVNNKDDAETFLLSASQKIICFHELINAVTSEKMIENVFKNTFDGVGQIATSQEFLHVKLPKFYYDFYVKTPFGIRVLENDEIKNDNANALGQTLRLMKFFVEKDGKKTEVKK